MTCSIDALLHDSPSARPALIGPDVRLTRSELMTAARKRAEVIERHVPPDARLAFVDTEDHEAVVTIIAALLARRSLAMVPPSAHAELDRSAAAARCAAIAHGGEIRGVTAPLNADPFLSPRLGVETAGSPEAVVLFTSGTTSEPKGVRLTRLNLSCNLTAMSRTVPAWGERDRMGLVLALTHSFGLSMVLLALAREVPIVLVGGAIPGRATAATMEAEKVTILPAVPYYIRLVSKRGFTLGSPDFAPHLATLLLAGGGISDSELDRVAPVPPEHTFLMYGFTEATARVAVRRRGDGAPPGSVGLPLPGTYVDIVGPAGESLPWGTTGRVRVNSSSLMLGLLGSPPRVPGEPFVTTDLGYVDDAGNLFITGRQAEMLNFRGNRVSLVEQEARLAAIPGVHEARLVPDSEAEDAQCRALLVAPGADPGPIRRIALRVVEPRGLIRELTFVEQVPSTRTGKPIRRIGQSSGPEEPGA